MKTRTHTLFTFFVLLSSLIGVGSAATLYVGGGGYSTIQTAINAAATSGDEIEVAPGTYNEAINFNGKPVRLYSSGGPEATIIDGTGNYHVVQCISGEDPNTIIEGFTITGGDANGPILDDRLGGGMFNYAASPTVTNCIFIENAAIHGGGMYNNQSNPVITDCIFKQNLTHDGQTGISPGGTGEDGGNGAGMFNEYSSPVVSNCSFTENSTGNGGSGSKGKNSVFGNSGDGGNGGCGGFGAGILNYNSSPMMRDCTFSMNITGAGGAGGQRGDKGLFGSHGHGGDGGEGGKGGGVYNCQNSAPLLFNCILNSNTTGNGGESGLGGGFLSNDASGGGGGHGAGMCNDTNSLPTVSQCQFIGNITGNGELGKYSGNGGNGAGMYNHISSPSIENCEFTDNVTGNGNNANNYPGHGGGGAAIYNGNQSSPIIEDCIFNKNLTGNGGSAILRGNNVCNGASGGDGAGMYNDDYSSPVVTDCQFTENKTGHGGKGGNGVDNLTFFVSFRGGHGGRGGYGAGIYNGNYSSPTISSCDFITNNTGNGGNGGRGSNVWFFMMGGGNGGNGGVGGHGAGMYNSENTSPSLNNCSFSINITGNGGGAGKPGKGWWKGNWGRTGSEGNGAGMANYASSTTVMNTVFNGNTSNLGGGVYNFSSDSIFAGCVFIQNTAHQDGSGMYNDQSNSTVTNCTFHGNSAYRRGGGMYNDHSNPLLTNSIFWDNDAPNSSDISNSESAPVISYCNIGDYDPFFAGAEGRLSATSPCQGVGDNNAPNLPERDLDGNLRIIGSTVDLGAFEYTDLPIHNITQDTFYDRIQNAINDANDFDEIRVLPGTYGEAINFNGKAVRLNSNSGPEVTIIDANGSSSVVTCTSSEGNDTVLEGFTITGGTGSPDIYGQICGGGFRNENSSPTIMRCIFTGNTAEFGAGLFNYNSSPAVSNCQFTGNSASRFGGGIYNNLSHPVIANCIFTGNTAINYGAGIFNGSSQPSVTNCIFNQNNVQNGKGGGIANYDSSNSTITNCVFYQNSAPNDIGGGIRNWNSSPTITNCIIWNNSPDEISTDGSSFPVVTHNNVLGGHEGIGNINMNPLFFDPDNGDFGFLSSHSPCVDTGNNMTVDISDIDIEGNPRLWDGNMDGTDAVDMGASEFIGRVRNLSQVIAYHNIQDAIDEGVDGDQVIVTPGTYYENIDFKGRNIALKSMDPNDSRIVNQTVLDGQHTGSVVTFSANEDPNCILAGFTIRHGKVNYFEHTHGGAGIYCYQSSPTIEDCIIHANQAIIITGSGIYCDGASPKFSRCIVTNNTSIGTTDAQEDLVGTVAFDNGNNAVLKDCIITNNKALEVAGLLCRNSTLMIDGGSISENESLVSTGGIYSQQSNISVKDCAISYNIGDYVAGGIECEDGNMSIEYCNITENSSDYLGGGISGCTGPVTNSVITGNYARWYGGGLISCTGPVTNCMISDNIAGKSGGGMSSCSGPIVNCLITGNISYRGGAGLAGCNDLISNCTIIGNSVKDFNFTEGGGLSWCNGTITNCIIWDNFAATSESQLFSSSVPSYSCVQDWTGGGLGNTTQNPNFVQSGYWAHIDDPNVVLEPYDPNAVWMDGNYHLTPDSPCIDVGDNTAVTEPNDLDGLVRIIDGDCDSTATVDMGAFEFDWLYWGDFAGGCDVNLADFAVLAQSWLQDNPAIDIVPYLDPDGIIDLGEMSILCENWLVGTSP